MAVAHASAVSRLARMPTCWRADGNGDRQSSCHALIAFGASCSGAAASMEPFSTVSETAPGGPRRPQRVAFPAACATEGRANARSQLAESSPSTKQALYEKQRRARTDSASRDYEPL